MGYQNFTENHDFMGDDLLQCEGRVLAVTGNGIRISDRFGLLGIGGRVIICRDDDHKNALLAEVVSLGTGEAFVLPFGDNASVRRGASVIYCRNNVQIRPHKGWLGRVIDGLGRPVDGLGPLPSPEDHEGSAITLRGTPPPAALRARLGERVDFGVKAMNAFTPARAGQRLGIFSGSGVGKSSLLGMVARNTRCDVRVIALIGERGREVREFIEDDLGPEGLAKSIVIVATADEAALMRREAGFLALAISEYFRDKGDHVLCLMDSITRIAMAQREIGLAAGEPPASRGYTPSVFSLLPSMLERVGPGLMPVEGGKTGFITGIFTVLVEGDDHDEPISDHSRAILDGHIVLDRDIAERGRFPAINILKSLSRTATDAMSEEECAHYIRTRQLTALHNDMADLIKIGAYQQGSNPEIDIAIDFFGYLEEFLTQSRHDKVNVEETLTDLSHILSRVRPS